MHAEDAVRSRHRPVDEWRFFKVGDAIETGGGPIAGLKHVAGDLRLYRVHIIHQVRRTDDAADKNDCGEGDDDQIKIGMLNFSCVLEL
jgi:hypothetical protein